jgi:hypothetical protein
MSRDLAQLLRTTAVTPSEPVAPTSLIVRARRRRQRRVALTGGGAVVAAVVAVSVLMGGESAPQSPEITDQPPATIPVPDPEESGDPSAVPNVGTIELAEVARALLVYGPSGARQVTGESETVVTSDGVVAAFPDLRGGVVLQATDETGGTIYRFQAGEEALEPLPVSTDPVVPTLRGVVVLDGEPMMLFTARRGTGENETETLHAMGLDSNRERELGVTGRYDSGLGGVGASGGQLLYTGCHLHCTLYRVPPGSTTDAEDIIPLFGAGEQVQGLDVVGGTAVYVRVGLHPDGSDEPPMLLLHDLEQEQRREIELPRPQLPVAFGTVDVDLAPDRDAALVSFRHPEQDDQVQTLLIDRLDDDAPQLWWLDSDQHIAFDAPSVEAASQSPEDAARDGVLPSVAALPFDVRVNIPVDGVEQPAEITTEEGVWVLSRLNTQEAYERSDGCGLGATDNVDAVYRRDVICTIEYGEILLLNHAQDRILRAYPLPGLPPQQLLATDDAVYCARTGDGALPDGMLCRIDRGTFTSQVRIFPAESSSAFDPQGADPSSGLDPETGTIWLPPSWTITDHRSFTPGELSFDNGQLTSTHAEETTPLDPGTLTPTDP